MTNKKMRNKTAKMLRREFEIDFVLAHRLCKEFQKHFGYAPKKTDHVLGLLVAAKVLKVVDTHYHDNSYYRDGYHDDDLISHTLEDKNGRQFDVCDWLPGVWGIDWGLSELESVLKK